VDHRELSVSGRTAETGLSWGQVSVRAGVVQAGSLD